MSIYATFEGLGRINLSDVSSMVLKENAEKQRFYLIFYFKTNIPPFEVAFAEKEERDRIYERIFVAMNPNNETENSFWVKFLVNNLKAAIVTIGLGLAIFLVLSEILL